MESQRERTPHVTDTPRCRLSLNDLEQLNAARSESFQSEKLHSPRLSSVSAPVLTPRHAHTLGAANLTVHGTSFFQPLTPRSQHAVSDTYPSSINHFVALERDSSSTSTQSPATGTRQSSHTFDVGRASIDSESFPEDLLLSEDSITEEKRSSASQHVFNFESPSVIRESLCDRIRDIKSFCIDTGKVEMAS